MTKWSAAAEITTESSPIATATSLMPNGSPDTGRVKLSRPAAALATAAGSVTLPTDVTFETSTLSPPATTFTAATPSTGTGRPATFTVDVTTSLPCPALLTLRSPDRWLKYSFTSA